MATKIQFFEPAQMSVYAGLVPPETLAEINATLDAATGQATESATPQALAELVRRGAAFRELEGRLCEAARTTAQRQLGRDLGTEAHHVVRRSSKVTQSESHCRHFDSHLLTLLVPLQLAPEGTFNGDLVVYHRRRESVSALGNVACKIRHGIHRNLPFTVRKKLTLRDLRVGKCEKVPVELGSVYVFNGFAIKHANLDVEIGQRRSLLIHYYDPGYSMGLSKLTRLARKTRDRIRGPVAGRQAA